MSEYEYCRGEDMLESINEKADKLKELFTKETWSLEESIGVWTIINNFLQVWAVRHFTSVDPELHENVIEFAVSSVERLLQKNAEWYKHSHSDLTN